MTIDITRVVTEKWEVSSCQCGEDPEIFDRRTNQDDAQARQVVIHCPECGREVTSAYRYSWDEIEFIKNRYKAMISAIAGWENLWGR